MTEERSHGWKNRQTWNIVLWLMNEEPLYRACVEYAKSCKATRLGRPSSVNAYKFVRDLLGDKTPDGFAVGPRADWKAIAEAIAECAA